MKKRDTHSFKRYISERIESEKYKTEKMNFVQCSNQLFTVIWYYHNPTTIIKKARYGYTISSDSYRQSYQLYLSRLNGLEPDEKTIQEFFAFQLVKVSHALKYLSIRN